MSKLATEISEDPFGGSLELLDFTAQYRGDPVQVRLVYIPHRNGGIDTATFLSFIKDHIFRKFVISCSEVRKAYLRKGKEEADDALFKKALRKFSRSTTKGKLGELLLYMFIELLLKAPKIISKISTLDDRNTHVKGADAVHAQYVDGGLLLYLGESKLHQSYSNACCDAVASLKDTVKDYQGEFDLIETSLDFPNMTEPFAQEILRILDPYNNTDLPALMRHPCFIGFDSAICRDVQSADDYEANYRQAAQARIDTFYGHASQGLDIDRLHLFLLPFESIEAFAQEFIDHLGVED